MLSYKYKKNSTLRHRDFHVDVRIWFADDSDQYATYQVDAPDAVMAYEVVRRHLDLDLGLNRFMVESIREVIMVWHGDCHYRVPSIRVMLDNHGWVKYS
jgi:hypothetical protein